MSEKFYRLTREELIEVSNLLRDAELRVYLYLCTLIPFSDSQIEIDTATIAEQLNLTRRTIQRALKRLDELKLLDVEIVKAKVKRHTDRQATGGSPERHMDRQATGGSPERHTDRPSDTRIARATDGSPERHTDRPSGPEALPSAESGSLQTIKTYSDFIDSLSEDEREKFFNWAHEQAQELPKPPTLVKRWIEANAEELIEKFCRVRPTTPANGWESHPRWSEALDAMRRGVPRFIALGEGFEEMSVSDRRAMAIYAEDNGFVWGDRP